MTNNYIRNSSGDYFFFDDRREIDEANEAARKMPRPRKSANVVDRVVAFRQAPGLHVDGYVGLGSFGT